MKRTAAAAASFVASTQPWASGDEITITCVSVGNDTSNNKDWMWGVKRYEADVYVSTVDGRAAGEYAAWNGEVCIPSEYKVIVKFISPGAGDKLTVNIFGYITKQQ